MVVFIILVINEFVLKISPLMRSPRVANSLKVQVGSKTKEVESKTKAKDISEKLDKDNTANDRYSGQKGQNLFVL